MSIGSQARQPEREPYYKQLLVAVKQLMFLIVKCLNVNKCMNGRVCFIVRAVGCFKINQSIISIKTKILNNESIVLERLRFHYCC